MGQKGGEEGAGWLVSMLLLYTQLHSDIALREDIALRASSHCSDGQPHLRLACMLVRQFHEPFAFRHLVYAA